MSLNLGLIGYPLGHSLSPKLHSAAMEKLGLTGEYLLYPVEPKDNHRLATLLNRVRFEQLTGLNVTIPHKQNVIPLVDDLTPTAQTIGAVNTLFMKDEKLIGHNTDAPGFLLDLQKLLAIKPKKEKKAMVLGSGGGARAVVYALLVEQWQVTIAALLLDQAEALVEEFHRNMDAKLLKYVPNDKETVERELNGINLIVNTTPVGMFPEIDYSPWPQGLFFPKEAVIYDLVYNPRETLFVRQAKQTGLYARTGLGMLVEQAALSFECWTGKTAPRDVMFASVELI